MPELNNLKHERFARHYSIELDITAASEAAGYVVSNGYKLIKTAKVRERILELQRGTADRMAVGQNQALREACYMAFSDITETLACFSPEDFQRLPPHVRKVIKSIDITETDIPLGRDGDGNQVTGTKRQVKIQMHSKSDPLRLVAQVTGLLDADNRDHENLAFTGITILADIVNSHDPGCQNVQPAASKTL